MNADKIIVLSNGKLVEEGAHQQLLAKESIYQRLWDQQFPRHLQAAFSRN